MIPNIIHFIHGLEPDFGRKEFCLAHYLAVKSALLVNEPDNIYLYYAYEPHENIWWEKTKKIVITEKIFPPETIYGNKLYHVAHKADVVRLQKLISRGGIYLDLDTICVKPFHPLRNHSFVMGLEQNNDEIKGLCNAVMLSEEGALFPQIWLETYRTFRSRGFDSFWAEHSVVVPYQLSQHFNELQSEIHIEPYTSFFNPSYHTRDLKNMFVDNIAFKDAYCHHLWETFTYEKYLKHLTINSIMKTDSTYHLIARRFL